MTQYYILKDTKLEDITKLNNSVKEEEEEEFELIILKIPSKHDINFDKLFQKRKRRGGGGGENKKKKKNNNNTTIDDYVNNLKRCTEKCIEILVDNFDIQRDDIYNEKNIFCPFHENKYTSKSPSAKFIIKNNHFLCFSTNCILKSKQQQQQNYSSLNSITFLNKLTGKI